MQALDSLSLLMLYPGQLASVNSAQVINSTGGPSKLGHPASVLSRLLGLTHWPVAAQHPYFHHNLKPTRTPNYANPVLHVLFRAPCFGLDCFLL